MCRAAVGHSGSLAACGGLWQVQKGELLKQGDCRASTEQGEGTGREGTAKGRGVAGEGQENHRGSGHQTVYVY
jgi:hypothetical protein